MAWAMARSPSAGPMRWKQSQAESAGGSRRAGQERVGLRESHCSFVHSRKKPGQPRRVHATYRIIHAVVVQVVIPAGVAQGIGRGKPSHRRIIIPPAEAHQAGVGIFQAAGSGPSRRRNLWAGRIPESYRNKDCRSCHAGFA